MKTTTQTKPDLNVIMDKQVANFSILYMKLHHFHWYVKGPDFFTLHIKFEELYNEAALHLDAIAERMLALGKRPTATLKEQLALSSVKEASGRENAQEMVQSLSDDLEVVRAELSEGINLAEQGSDQPTADLFIAIRASLEKTGWMLQAYLGK
ncbi:DNA starvation/stationary phase protection protein [Paenibacillus whitsoniae]|uniref:DNA starvation/stationary phase protection protein n=2 Tax=Paenibacillus whitsoniae TaxID=2496558 RepID=A0A3S0ADX8_9BACL|nr:DNA starvation/stationary phase protection protein [Paenibacillus whitsoniae]RTE10687.1 DNA starvation/stationary phase protection protein [Paenibacillus whitsoniae]